MSDTTQVRRFGLMGARAASVFALALVAFSAWSAPVCVDPERGIGGTGAPARSGAIGGTGAPQGAIGGTGAVAGAIGGTGAPQGAIGGTGAVAGAIGGTGAPQGAIGGTGAVAGAIGGTGAPQGAIGGTGAVAGAIGGTGAPGGAIGGTGAVAGAAKDGGIGGTGIVGTVTGFASVCVGGLEVQYDEGTPVTVNGTESKASRLAVGQVIAIEAVTSARGLVAQHIAVLHAVAGPITQMGPGVVQVMGQPVRVGVGTRVAAAGALVALDSLKPGTVVQVSGYRNARGEVEASRIQEAPELAEHSAVGRIEHLSDRGFELNGVRVEGRTEGFLHEGEEALVRGHWQDGRLTAQEVRAEPTAAAIGRADRIVAEGLVGHAGRGELSLGAFKVRVSRETRIEGGSRELSNDQLVRVTGRVDRDRQVSADRIEIERRPGSGGVRSGDGGGGKKDGASGGDDSGSGSDDRSGSDRGGTADRPEGVDRPQRPEKVERPEKPEKIERPETGGGGGGGGGRGK